MAVNKDKGDGNYIIRVTPPKPFLFSSRNRKKCGAADDKGINDRCKMVSFSGNVPKKLHLNCHPSGPQTALNKGAKKIHSSGRKGYLGIKCLGD